MPPYFLQNILQCARSGKHALLFLFSFILVSEPGLTQQVSWGFSIGNSGVDNAAGTHIDANGNVYICGAFSGTNVDFDPSVAGTQYHSSNGLEDGFVAKYTATGQYLMSFTFGGSNLDKVYSVTTDQVNNIYITGFFRGANVDFDPGPGQFLMTSNGDAGGDPGYGGDIFVAKYTANGQFAWAFHVGGSSLADDGIVIKSDAAGNLFLGSYFSGNVDFDPGPGVHNLNGATGTLCLARYDTNGQYQWAFNFGGGDTNNEIFDIKLDANNFYVTGYFQGIDRDFDPSPGGTALISSNGGYDVFVSKYDLNGNYVFAFGIGGAGPDVGRGIVLDNTGNIYVLGDFNGTNIDFDPSAATNNLTSNGNGDVFVAKYNNNGAYSWAYNIGSAGNEYGWQIDLYNGGIFITGGFNSVADFDPSGATDNLTSHGGYDIFLAKYDLAGNYQCAFNIGSPADDFGNGIRVAGPDQFYLVGAVSGVDVDFDPTSSTYLLSSKGRDDAFLTKYYWPSNTLPNGSIKGARSCETGVSQLIYTSTTGTSPFTIKYTDGINTYTQSNVQNGVPFNTEVDAPPGTVFTLVSIEDGVRCSPLNNAPLSSGIIPAEGKGLVFDFAYATDLCNPLVVNFEGMHNFTGTYYWDFGDGTILIAGPKSSSHIYANEGNYTIRYGLTNGFCKDTIQKSISLNILRDNVVLTTDTTICVNTPKKLLTVPSLGFCWSPTTYLDNPNSPEPFATPAQDITYFFTSQHADGANLVVNGDFSQGNAGFASAYQQAISNTTEAQYLVGLNPKTWNVNLDNCVDHTTGNGNFMLVNGAPNANEIVWSQTITVNPNTNYAFSTWLENLASLNPAIVQFSINGIPLGPTISAGANSCTWKQFFTTWNSGSSTSATISIINQNLIREGNDFALDDIFFSQVFFKKDSVKITVDKPIVKTREDTTICTETPIQLFATGAVTYSWSPSTNLSSTSIDDPIATTADPIQYIVTGTNAKGCKASDTVNILIHPKPIITITPSQTICKNTTVVLMASGGVAYDWFPAQTLDNPFAGNLIASPTGNTLYYVDITDNHACIYRDSVQINIRPDPIFAVKGGGNLCLKDTMQLQASGGDIYSWQPANGLSNPASANPLATPDIPTNYQVTILETTCNQSTVLPVNVNVLPLPDVNATRNIDLDCFNDRSQLNATGATKYSWSPAITLTNPGISNPVATPRVATTYVVKGTDGHGCANYDSVTVKVELTNNGGYLMPNAFTPNNDGHNDCYGVRYWGVIDKIEFSIFNRWGQRIFFTRDPNGCWDGKVNGIEQGPDVFVYMVKASTLCEKEVFRKGTFVLIR